MLLFFMIYWPLVLTLIRVSVIAHAVRRPMDNNFLQNDSETEDVCLSGHRVDHFIDAVFAFTNNFWRLPELAVVEITLTFLSPILAQGEVKQGRYPAIGDFDGESRVDKATG
jgi:hypothetical protein